MHAQLITSAGTTNFSEQYRNITLTDEGNPIDITAGADIFRTYIGGLRTWTVTIEALYNGTATPFGTADDFALQANTLGTVIISPFGTTSGSIKYSGPFIVASRNREWPYDDVMPFNLELQSNGTLSYGTW
jgi:predicted secreted protein